MTAASIAPHNLMREKRISLSALSRREQVSIPTSWRWATRGCRGVKLETITIGGRRFTTEEAFERFAAACTAVSQGQSLSADHLQTPAARNRAHEQAERELDAAFGEESAPSPTKRAAAGL